MSMRMNRAVIDPLERRGSSGPPGASIVQGGVNFSAYSRNATWWTCSAFQQEQDEIEAEAEPVHLLDRVAGKPSEDVGSLLRSTARFPWPTGAGNGARNRTGPAIRGRSVCVINACALRTDCNLQSFRDSSKSYARLYVT